MNTQHFNNLFYTKLNFVIGLFLLALIILSYNSCTRDEVALDQKSPTVLKSITLPDEVLEKVTYGPVQFIRNDEDLTVYEVQMKSEDFRCHEPPYVLTVINGEEDGTFRVVSARILVDNIEIFRQSDFNKKVEELEQGIEIDESSMLRVELMGKPGTYIHLFITGERGIPSSPLAVYTFNGNADDNSGNNRHGILDGNIQFTQDRFGNENEALLFDGVDDICNLPTMPINRYFTINSWIQTFEGQDTYIFSETNLSRGQEQTTPRSRSRFYIYWNSENQKIYFHIRTLAGNDNDYDGYTISTVNPYSAGEWQFISAIRSNDELLIYINGELAESEVIRDYGNQANTFDLRPPHDDMSGFVMGAWQGTYYHGPGGARYYYGIGVIDDLSIFDYALSDCEVESLYEEGDWTEYNACDALGTFIDPRDDQEYQTVTIGDQVWMAENLAYLPAVSPSSASSSFQPYYYVYDYEGTNVSEAKATNNYSTYGVLYNWGATSEACPTGWHLPSEDEWQELEIYLGMSESELDNIGYRGTKQGTNLKAMGGWDNDGNGTNITCFNALPGGSVRYSPHVFYGIGFSGNWWSSTEGGNVNAWIRRLDSSNEGIFRDDRNFIRAFSIRCVKD